MFSIAITVFLAIIVAMVVFTFAHVNTVDDCGKLGVFLLIIKCVDISKASLRSNIGTTNIYT